MTRRGFTLVELLVAITLTAIVGVGLTSVLISDSRFVARQQGMMSARQAARAAMNTMAVELRMVADTGLIEAAPESVIVRVPYAFGIACERSSSQVVSLIPTDSLTYALATPSGFAWRNDTGTYQYYTGISVTTTTSSSDQDECDDADVLYNLPGGRLVEIRRSNGGGLPNWARPDEGRVTFLFQTVKYRFAPSAVLPGRIGLWRRAGTAADEELVTPFDASARFAFLVGESLTPQASPPSDLEDVRGLQLRLVGASDIHVPGSSGPETFDLVTNVTFLNKR